MSSAQAQRLRYNSVMSDASCLPFELASHCGLRPTPTGWWTCSGYTCAIWLDAWGAAELPPAPGALARALVAAPFATGPDGQFWALWQPPSVALNGWDPGAEAPISQIAVIRAAFERIIGPRVFAGMERHEIEARVLEVRGLLSFLDEPAVPTTLEGCLLNPRGRSQKLAAWDSQALVVETSLEGDVNFGFVLARGTNSLLLVEDTSICAGFFYAGHGRLSEAALAEILDPSEGNAAEQLAVIR